MALIGYGDNFFLDLLIQDKLNIEDYEISQNDTTGDLEVSHDGNVLMIIDSSGNVTITSGVINAVGDLSLRSNDTEYFRIRSNGMVALATGLNPTSFFHMRQSETGDNDFMRIINQGASTSGHCRLTLGQSSDIGAAPLGDNIGSISFLYDGNLDIDNRISIGMGTETDILQVRKDATANGRVNVNGSLGIGIISPTTKLHIYENDTGTGAGLLIEQDGSGDALLEFLLTSIRSWSMGIDNSSGDRFMISPQSDLASAVFSINTNGDIGIANSTNPQISLAIGDSDTGIDWVSDGVMRVMTNNAERLRFNAGTNGDAYFTLGSGHLGINESDPNEELHISGSSNPTIRIENTIQSSSHQATEYASLDFWTSDGAGDGAAIGRIVCYQSGGGTAPDCDLRFYTGTNAASNLGMTLDWTNNLDVVGTLTKGGGSFDIEHPNPIKAAEGYRLRHCFVEGNTAGDNHYYLQCEATTDNEVVEVDLPSYYKDLNENTRIFIQGVGHFGRAYGTINNQETKLEITCELIGKYDILCIGTRKDELATDYFSMGAEYQGTRKDYRNHIEEKKKQRENPNQ